VYKTSNGIFGYVLKTRLLTQFEHAESNCLGSKAEFQVFDHLICINKIAAWEPG